jgi:hypothetical protein
LNPLWTCLPQKLSFLFHSCIKKPIKCRLQYCIVYRWRLIGLHRIRLGFAPSDETTDRTTDEATSHLTKAASCRVIGYSHLTGGTTGRSTKS